MDGMGMASFAMNLAEDERQLNPIDKSREVSGVSDLRLTM
jgi:hypothetical protein